MLTRALENYHYTKKFCAERLKSNNASDKEMQSFKIYIDNDMQELKKIAIRDMNKCIPEHFKSSIVFTDWDSAMIFLEVNKNNKYFRGLND